MNSYQIISLVSCAALISFMAVYALATHVYTKILDFAYSEIRRAEGIIDGMHIKLKEINELLQKAVK